MLDKKFISDKYETPAFHLVLHVMNQRTIYLIDRNGSWNVYISAPYWFIQKLHNELHVAFGVKKGMDLHKLSPFERTQFVPGYEPKLVIFYFDYPRTLNHDAKMEYALPEDWDYVSCRLKSPGKTENLLNKLDS